MTDGETRKFNYLSPLAVGAYFAAFKLSLHFVFNSNYGYFRDELYYLACAEHLDWGYPDHAPMVALVAKASRAVLGDSLFAIRFFPALAGALKVFLTALLVREFGGRAYAAFLACLCVLCAPVFLAIDNFLSMNALEPVFWMLCVYFAIRAIKGERTPPGDAGPETPAAGGEIQNNHQSSRSWLWFGVFAGLGLMNKHSMAFFGLALVAGLLLTRARRVFLDKYFWLGGAVALLIFLPNVVWQIQNDFATLELLRNVQKTGKNVVLSPPGFVLSQIMMLLPATLPVWLAGVWHLLFDRAGGGGGGRFRFLGVAYLVLLALMIFLKAKDYYLAPVYPLLFAAGAVWWQEVFEGRRRKVKGKIGEQAGTLFSPFAFLLPSFKPALPILIVLMWLVALPVALPVLPVEKLIAYQEGIGFKPPKAEVSHEGVLQQVYGDQFGWPEMVEKTARVYHSLPPAEREKAAIWGSNYGEAAAVDFFGGRHNLPKAVSAHQSYFMWGPRGYTGEVLIILGGDKKDAEKACEAVEETPFETDHPYAMNEEKFKILVCRRTRKPLPEIWPGLKHWN